MLDWCDKREEGIKGELRSLILTRLHSPKSEDGDFFPKARNPQERVVPPLPHPRLPRKLLTPLGLVDHTLTIFSAPPLPIALAVKVRSLHLS